MEWDYTDGRNNEIIHGFEFEESHPPGDYLPPNGTGPPYGPASVYAFIDGCIGKEYYNGADALIGLKTVSTIDAIYRSARSGVTLTDYYHRYFFVLMPFWLVCMEAYRA
jgi:hypothetical protein